jgi:putative FmdB family regulatory protein
VPIYEYKCQKCGKELELMHKVNDPAPPKCPECQAEGSLEKLVSRTSFQLKGGGWYSDLYSSTKKGDTSSGGAASSATPTAAPASSSSTSSSSAPAAAPASSPSSSGNSGGSST